MVKLKAHVMFPVESTKVFDDVPIHDVAEGRDTILKDELGDKYYAYLVKSVSGLMNEFRSKKTRIMSTTPSFCIKKINTVQEVAEHRDRYYEVVFSIQHQDVEEGKYKPHNTDFSYEICKLTDKDDNGNIIDEQIGCWILSRYTRVAEVQEA